MDREKMAYDIALAYTKKSLEKDFCPEPNDIDNMVQAYVTAYSRVVAMNDQEIEALSR